MRLCDAGTFRYRCHPPPRAFPPRAASMMNTRAPGCPRLPLATPRKQPAPQLPQVQATPSAHPLRTHIRNRATAEFRPQHRCRSSSSSSRTNSNGNSSNSDGNSCRPTPISDGCSRRFKARLFSLLRRTPGLPDAGLPDAGLPLAVLIRQRGHMTMARPPGVHSARCRPAQIAFRSSPAAGFHTQSVSRRCDHGCSLPALFRSCGRD